MKSKHYVLVLPSIFIGFFFLASCHPIGSSDSLEDSLENHTDGECNQVTSIGAEEACHNETKKLVLTMSSCMRSAAVSFLSLQVDEAEQISYIQTTKGWFSPWDPVEIDVGDNMSVYLHVSFWDHGMFAANRFTRNDTSFCVDRNQRWFETQREVFLGSSWNRHFTHKYIDLNGSMELNSYQLTFGQDCPDSADLNHLGNFQYTPLESDVTTIDICEY